MTYYIYKSTNRKLNRETESVIRVYKMIDKFHTIAVHVNSRKINILRTKHFKGNILHLKPGQVVNTIYGPWIYLRYTTEKIFNYYFDKVRKENYLSYETERKIQRT